MECVQPTMAIMSGTQAQDIGVLVFETLQEQTPYVRAQAHLLDRFERLRLANKYTAGVIEVKGDMVVLTNIPFSGGEAALFGIMPRGEGYMIVDYEDSPDYMKRLSQNCLQRCCNG